MEEAERKATEARENVISAARAAYLQLPKHIFMNRWLLPIWFALDDLTSAEINAKNATAERGDANG